VNRAGVIEAFLAGAGWGGGDRIALAGDASARSYLRLRRGRLTAILMDMPPASGLDVAPFLAVTTWLRGLGLSAPEVLAADRPAGLVLLEDLGDALFARLCDTPMREHALYSAAIDLLADLQAAPKPGPEADWTPPPYDAAFLMREMRLAPEWYIPAASGRPVPLDLAAEFEALAAAMIAPILDAPPCIVLRDYHAENLIWLPGREGAARVGLLDYQDLVIGHAAYDVVSLIGDARRDLAPGLADAMRARYLARADADAEAFDTAAHVLAAQRNLKILGLFVRLARRDGKTAYLRHLPRVRAHLDAALVHPALGPMRRWVANHLPAADALAARPAMAAP